MICRCRAFPWAHSYKLSQRCRDEFNAQKFNPEYLSHNFGGLYMPRDPDAAERAAAMREAKWP